MKRVFTGLIRFYQNWISPWLPRVCRFQPSCSEYTIEALRKHGIIRGIYLGCRRILSCHPFSPRHSWDPVPEDPPF